MPPAVTALASRLSGTEGLSRQTALRVGALVALHLAALAVLIATEGQLIPAMAFVLFWGLLNFLTLILVARPMVAAALSLALIAAVILLSQFKHDILLTTVNFVDLMVIDADTFSFLMQVFPRLGTKVAIASGLLVVGLVLLWRFDPFRVRRRTALMSALACFGALIALALAVPSDPWDEFYAENYVSKFARSGVTAVGDLMTRGILDSDATTPDRLATAVAGTTCTLRKPPHIVMVFDEFELRHPRRAGRQGAGRLRRAFQVERRPAAQPDGRRRGRTELVHRIQRAHGIVGALLWAFRGFRHAYRRRARGARPAAHLEEMRLQDLHALSDVRRVPQRATLPADRRHPELPRFQRRSAPISSIPTRSISTRRRRRSPRRAARTRCSCWSTPRRTTFRGISASVLIWRRNGRISATGRTWTSICGVSI